MSRPFQLSVLIGGASTAIGSGLYIEQYVGSHLIWGGTVCESTRGIYACTGYPPTGIVALLIISMIGWLAVVRVLEGAQNIVAEVGEI